MCPVNSPFGQGVVYLYKVGGKQTLVFIATEERQGGHTTADLELPDHDIKSLGSFADKDGLSELLLAGSKSLYRHKKIYRMSKLLTLSEDELFNGVDNLFIAQRNDRISILFRNSAHILGYLKGDRTLSSLVDNDIPPIPLTQKGRGIQFSAVIDDKSSSQRFLLSYEDGSFSLLEQSNSSGIWKEAPFHVPSLDKNLEMPSYTCLAQLKDDTGAPLAQEKVLLTSSSWGTATVNGQTITVDSDGVEVETDAGGRLNIVIPVSDIASSSFLVKNVPGNDHLHEPLRIDPSYKTQSKLGNISATQLREAKTSDGTSLVDPKISNPDLEVAATAISRLHGLISEQKDGYTMQREINGFKDWVWGAWNFIREKINDVTHWIMEKLEDAWHFVVTIAGKTWKFILDTTERIINAIQFVFEKIGAAFKKLYDWLSFIFRWGDVLETMDGITSMVDGMLTFGEKFLTDQAAPAVTHFFERIEAPIREAKKKLSQTVKDTQASSKEADTQDEHVKKVQDARNSVPANWSKRQLDYGGVKENMRVASLVGTENDPNLDKVWDELKKAWGQFEKDCGDINKTIAKAWKAKGSTSVKDVLTEITFDIVLLILDAVRGVALAVVGVGASIIALLRKILTAEINVPILTPLFKLIAGGRKLTLLNAISLLIAVPVTIVAKIVTGEKPKKITGFKYDDMVAGKLTPPELAPYTDLAGWITTIYYTIDGLIEVYKILTYQLPIEPESPVSPSVLSIVGRLILCAFTFPYDRQAPRWPVRVGIWGTTAFHILIVGVLQRSKVAIKAAVGVDVLAGMITFSLAQIVHDGEFKATKEEWKGKDDKITALHTQGTVLELVEQAASAYGQLGPDKILSVAVVGGCAISHSAVAGIIAGMERLKIF
ncbi:hypothetical protein BYT27DRAFT_7195849 [Phlegmacium glaucopus]|nr:hypothetical protein BYT27DRAFT_7195849 [Phlegmacium glaucopus]